MIHHYYRAMKPIGKEALESETSFKTMKEKYDSISLIKLLERTHYGYQSHEYTSLIACEVIDRLWIARHPEDVYEAIHYDMFKTIVEVCKACRINLALIFNANVDMAIEQIHKGEKISKESKFKDRKYYALN